jgi:hypothetical protein
LHIRSHIQLTFTTLPWKRNDCCAVDRLLLLNTEQQLSPSDRFREDRHFVIVPQVRVPYLSEDTYAVLFRARMDTLLDTGYQYNPSNRLGAREAHIRTYRGTE